MKHRLFEKLKAEDYKGLQHLQGKVKRHYLINLKHQDEKHLLPFSIKNAYETFG